MNGSISSSTQDLLKDMMRKSGVSHAAEKKIMKAVQEKGALPSLSPKVNRKNEPRQLQAYVTFKGPARRSSVKPLQDIIRDNPYERDMFFPRATKNRDVEKDRLAKFMETDGYSKPAEEELLKQVQLQREEARSKEEDMDLIDMLAQEIDERRQWLQEMYELGEGAKHHHQIMSEINLRIKQMEQLERQRAAQ